MKEKLIASLFNRIQKEITPQNPVRFLKEVPARTILENAIPVIYLYTRVSNSTDKVIYLTELVSAIGHSIRTMLKLPKDSALAAKSGAFVLYSFEEIGIIKVRLGTGKGKHASYHVDILNDDAIVSLWEENPLNKIEKLPSDKPYAMWKMATHPTGKRIVKTNNLQVLQVLKPETHPIVFDTVNKAQAVGWVVNKQIYSIVNWALRNKTEAFADIWELQNPEARQSKLREAKAISDIAKRFLNKTFYHLYYLDFRGRKYPTTAYFHEQGNDLARGLLLRSDSKAIGQKGFFWLCVSIANNWAGSAGREDGRKTDKIPIRDRAVWALDNEEIFLDYAENPKINRGWMQADKPWQFLAACTELMNLRIWQQQNEKQIADKTVGLYDYESPIEVFIDGSNNGSQHLSALTQDEITAVHVNLLKQDFPGDLYSYVAEHVWKKINAKVAELSPAEIKDCDEIIEKLTSLKVRIKDLDYKSELRKHLVDEIVKLKKENEELISIAGLVFWHRITDLKSRRKICKRNVMTLPYGGTAYGLG